MLPVRLDVSTMPKLNWRICEWWHTLIWINSSCLQTHTTIYMVKSLVWIISSYLQTHALYYNIYAEISTIYESLLITKLRTWSMVEHRGLN